MKQNILLVIFILLLTVPCPSQRNSQKSVSNPEAQKFIQLTFTDQTELSLYIVRFAKVLRKNPVTKACVIVYERYPTNEYMKPASSVVLSFALDELKRFKIPLNRIVSIEGGAREDLMIELFIVPKGAASPIPTPTIDTNGAKLKPQNTLKKRPKTARL